MRWLLVALAFQAALVVVVVGERLLPRVSGDEVRIPVRPVDPIDPFRGAYVDLDYAFSDESGEEGRVYVPLGPDGRPDPVTRVKPSGRFLRCHQESYRIRCGIESFFASQDEARRLERVLAGDALARVKVDGAGRAAIVAIEPR